MKLKFNFNISEFILLFIFGREITKSKGELILE